MCHSPNKNKITPDRVLDSILEWEMEPLGVDSGLRLGRLFRFRRRNRAAVCVPGIKSRFGQLPGLRVPNQHLANKVAWDAARKADKDLFADLIGVKPEGQNNPS